MREFVLHTSTTELARCVRTSSEWLELIQNTHQKGVCDTFSLTLSDTFDNEYSIARRNHHAIGPMLEIASIGRRQGESWVSAGWLCTFITTEREIHSLCNEPEHISHSEFSVYTGVHIVAENCLHPLPTLVDPVGSFLQQQTRDPNFDWLDFNLVFMTHEMYREYQNREKRR